MLSHLPTLCVCVTMYTVTVGEAPRWQQRIKGERSAVCRMDQACGTSSHSHSTELNKLIRLAIKRLLNSSWRSRVSCLANIGDKSADKSNNN